MKSGAFLYNHLMLICILLACLSCSKKPVHPWTGKQLLLPGVQDSKNKKIVNRFLGDCSSCIESIDTWKAIHDAAKMKSKNIQFIFFVETIKQEDFDSLKAKLQFSDNVKVVFDQQGGFFQRNLLKYPFGIEYQTFLLNDNNEIVLVGNPAFLRPMIREYIEAI
ncbi:MAG: hypothetical protein ABIS36_06560 [Chryseolinea sp.]